jgi:FkbH-like protein
MTTPSPEPVRLVVWDLDETFWHGTLTEGGHRYRRDVHDIVVTLAQRGIVSSVCSKNDMATVRAVLEAEGIWDYFVFPSINWDPKGPRLAAMVEDVQLRPPTIMFIDDNPMNLGEAQHYVPGIQVASDAIIPDLLSHPLFRGKVDTDLTRLKQYQLLQRRKADEAQAAAASGDNTAFLRESGIVVTIEHDLEPHLDRAIELINRTNQLNFTKARLPEDPEAARAELREQLAFFATQAGIIRVRDRYGDYGYCGLYVMLNRDAGKKLRHFCFSCRILNMGIESWLYQRLERPRLRVVGDVLTDVKNDDREVDWITVEMPNVHSAAASQAQMLDYVYIRGACDLRAVEHYFGIVTNCVRADFNTVESGSKFALNHSLFARHALEGLPDAARQAFMMLGYAEAHFHNNIPALPQGGQAIWIMAFWAEALHAIYAHKETGLTILLPKNESTKQAQDMTSMDAAEEDVDAHLVAYLREHFEFRGRITDEEYKQNLRAVLRHAPPQVRVFMMLASETRLRPDGTSQKLRRSIIFNDLTKAVAAEFANVELLNISDYVAPGESQKNPDHFDRMVYFKLFQDIMRRVGPNTGSLAAD